MSLKPGQLTTIHNTVYRAKRRSVGCQGCDLRDLILCPCIVDKRYKNKRLNCALDNIILKKI